MKRLLGLMVALCLGALLVACGGGDDKDNLGVTISAVPTRSVDALGDFATLTPVPTLVVPTVVPTTAPPAPTNTPLPPAPSAQVQAQAPAATATPQPAPQASAATPVVVINGTPGPNNTFTYGAGPPSGTAACAPVGSAQVGPPGGGQGQPMILQGNVPPGGPPPGGPTGNQVFSAGVGGADPTAGLAGFLGMSTAQLQSELSQKGATQASIAARHGKSRDQLRAFLIEQTRKTTADAVSKGQMTQTQATQLVSQFTTDVDKVIDGAGGCGPVTFAPGPAR